MGVLRSIGSVVRANAAFSGRASAQQFYYVLGVFVAGLTLAGFVSAWAVKSYQPGQGELPPDAPILIWCGLSAVPLLATGARRLRDAGLARIWTVPAIAPFFLLGAFITSLLSVGGFGAGAALALLFPILVLWVIGLFILFSFSSRAVVAAKANTPDGDADKDGKE